jgi:hypothetical protein
VPASAMHPSARNTTRGPQLSRESGAHQSSHWADC